MLEVRGLDFAYGETPVLRQLSTAFNEGHFSALAGPNGSGKSTLLSILAGDLLPRPGSLICDGAEWNPRAGSSKRIVGFASQQFELDPDSDARETMQFSGALFGLNPKATQERIASLNPVFGLGELAGRSIKKLSGGQKRRLHLAASVVHSPQWIIWDEPFTGIDAQYSSRIMEFLLGERKSGKGIIVCTHNIRDVATKADRVTVIRQGSIVVSDEPGRISELYGKWVLVATGDAKAQSKVAEMLHGYTEKEDKSRGRTAFFLKEKLPADIVPVLLDSVQDLHVEIKAPGLDTAIDFLSPGSNRNTEEKTGKGRKKWD